MLKKILFTILGNMLLKSRIKIKSLIDVNKNTEFFLFQIIFKRELIYRKFGKSLFESQGFNKF
jgi:hypothetical protein